MVDLLSFVGDEVDAICPSLYRRPSRCASGKFVPHPIRWAHKFSGGKFNKEINHVVPRHVTFIGGKGSGQTEQL
jgi:hypothetical protein